MLYDSPDLFQAEILNEGMFREIREPEKPLTFNLSTNKREADHLAELRGLCFKLVFVFFIYSDSVGWCLKAAFI